MTSEAIRRATWPALIAALVAVAALWAVRPAAAEDQTISLENVQFVPADVTINVGDTVTWVHNDDSIPHTVTSADDDGAMFDQSLPDSSAAPFTFTFNEAGEFEYFCRIHPTNMRGVVTVLAQQETPTATTTPTTQPTSTPTTQPTGTPTTAPTGVPNPPSTGTGLAASHESGTPWALWLVSALALAAVGGGTALAMRKAASRR
jgi:plastocyanin